MRALGLKEIKINIKRRLQGNPYAINLYAINPDAINLPIGGGGGQQ